MAVPQAFQVISHVPVVVSDGGVGISYQPNQVFFADPQNPSVMRLVSTAQIIPTVGNAPPNTGVAIITGPPGPTGPAGPPGPTGVDDDSMFVNKDGSVALTADWNVGSHKITGLTNGSASSDAAAFGQIPTTLPPSGSAGGALGGSYPNPGFATPVILANGTVAFTGNQSLGGHNINSVADPALAQDAATKNYVDTQNALFIHKDGSVAFIGNQSLGGHNLTSVGALSLAGSTSGSTTFAAGVTPTPTTYTWPAAPINGNFLSTDASGNLSWAAAGGGGGENLDTAYDFGGAGAGRTIVADAGAFEVQQSSIKVQGIDSNAVATLPWTLHGSTGGVIGAAAADPASFAVTSAVAGSLAAGIYTVSYTWTNANGESLLSPIVGIADPPFSPTWYFGDGGGSLTAGLFHAVFTATNAAGETRASPILTIDNTSGNYSRVVIIFTPGLTGATSYKLYFSDAANSNTLRFAGSVVSAGTQLNVTAYPSGAQPTPPLVNTTEPCTISVNGSQAIQVAALTPLPGGVTGVNYYLTATNGTQPFLITSGNGSVITLNTTPTAPFTIPPVFNTTASGAGEALKFISGTGFDASQAGGDFLFYVPRSGQNWPVFAGRISGIDGSISFPGAGGVSAQSERFGLTSQAIGLRSTAFGFNAIAGLNDSTVVGANTNAVSAHATVMGSGSTARGLPLANSGPLSVWPTVAIGNAAAAGPLPGATTVAGASISDCIAIGDAANAGSGGGSCSDCIAIGDGAGAGSYSSGSDFGTYSDCIAIGNGTNAGANGTGASDMIAIGDGASANGSSDCIAIGDGASAGQNYRCHDAVAIGNGASANNQLPDGDFGASADGVTTAFSGTVPGAPILADVGILLTYVIAGTPYTAHGKAHGVASTSFSGSHISSGSINFTTGAFSVTFSAAPDSGTQVQIGSANAFGIGIGTGANARHNYAICLGANSLSTADRQLVIGGPNAGLDFDASITDVYIGSGVQQYNQASTTAASVVIHASGAATSAGQNGASIRLASGLPSSTSQLGGKVGIQNVTPGTMTLADATFWDRGNVVLAPGGAIATTATDGFTYIPTCAGPPTGAATAYAGAVPLVYDTTDNRLYVNVGGTTWKSAAFA